MRDKVLAFWRAQALPEDTAVTCAVSGGADSVAMKLPSEAKNA